MAQRSTLFWGNLPLSVTILQDAACDEAKEPFCSYELDIPDVKVIKTDLADDSLTADSVRDILGGATFDYIWDNASKGAKGSGQAIIDCANQWSSKLLCYVSSAGVYLPAGEFPMPETTPVKEAAGQVEYERHALESGIPFCSFRPQYIYGEKSNKWDYIDWYFDRIVAGAPLPIPSPGSQKVSLTNSADVASLLASVLNDEKAAAEQVYFNCGTSNLVSYDEVASMCAEAAGLSAKIEHYDPELGKAKFPFRLTDFYVAPDMATSKLRWEGPKCNLKDDLGWYYKGYKARKTDGAVDLSVDDEVLKASTV